jgi:hypothetical protein
MAKRRAFSVSAAKGNSSGQTSCTSRQKMFTLTSPERLKAQVVVAIQPSTKT